ncbi:hypothetical protein IKF15_03405 [Candidatus Saccharibacteria bacterium]|nr:hypothetical protein [Candidatus Saccharibacteria bacterium]
MSNQDALSNELHSQKSPIKTTGGRNLVLLGVGSVAIALVLVALSITIYRASGDIYLDRSRPGYISEDETRDDSDTRGTSFSNEGAITARELDLYLEQLDQIEQYLNTSSDAFSEAPLSDDALVISPDVHEDVSTSENKPF